MKFYADDQHVRALGRTLFKDGIRYLGFSCSGIEFQCETTKVTARLWTDGREMPEIHKAWAAVFVDDADEPVKRFELTETEAEYVLYESQQERPVTIKLIKYSEDAFAALGIRQLETAGDKPVCATRPLERKLLFFGDSITCGFGVEGVNGEDLFSTHQENPWHAYAAMTARTLKSEMELVSWSGIGLYSSWTADGTRVSDPLMAQICQYTDPGLMRRYGSDFAQPWNSKEDQPDMLIIYLGTNDESYTGSDSQRIQAFGEAYYDFLARIRADYKEVPVLCVLGTMGQTLYPEIEKQVLAWKQQNHDEAVYALCLELQKASDGTGSEAHPSYKTQQKAAARLSKEICRIKGWTL